MANYTKLTDFASKDALPTGNAAKIVKGTEIDDEFEALEIAVATKADIASPAFSGTPTALTAATTTNTTQLATTAFVQQEITANAPDLSVLYPVGSVYINASVSTNPDTLLGFGTWAAFGAGRVLVGLDADDVDFDTVEETGGAKTHTLTIVVNDDFTATITVGAGGDSGGDPGEAGATTEITGSLSITATGGGGGAQGPGQAGGTGARRCRRYSEWCCWRTRQ
jgi:hypothetical protein